MEWRAEINQEEAEQLLEERQREIEEKLAIASGAFIREIQIREYETTKTHLGDCCCNRPSTNNSTTLKRCLDKIHDARRNIRNNTYGICRKCDGPVPKERLRIRPETDLCVPCKKNSSKNPLSNVGVGLGRSYEPSHQIKERVSHNSFS